MTSSIFISYSKDDQEEVDRFYEILTHHLFCDIFKADKNLQAAENYEEGLKDQIKQCDILIAFISEKFNSSAYANQEIGYALAYNKPIYPITLDGKMPLGFIHLIQAKSFKSDRYGSRAEFRLCTDILNKSKISTKKIIADSPKIKHFVQTNILSKILESRKDYDYDDKDIDILEKAYKNNDQIYDAHKGNRIKAIIEKYKANSN